MGSRKLDVLAPALPCLPDQAAFLAPVNLTQQLSVQYVKMSIL